MPFPCNTLVTAKTRPVKYDVRSFVRSEGLAFSNFMLISDHVFHGCVFLSGFASDYHRGALGAPQAPSPHNPTGKVDYYKRIIESETEMDQRRGAWSKLHRLTGSIGMLSNIRTHACVCVCVREGCQLVSRPLTPNNTWPKQQTAQNRFPWTSFSINDSLSLCRFGSRAMPKANEGVWPGNEI